MTIFKYGKNYFLRKIKNQKLLKLDTLLKTNRIYPKTEFTRHIINDNNRIYTELDRLNSIEPIFGQIGFGDEILTNISLGSHYVENIRIVDDWLVGDVSIFDEYLFSNLDKYVFRTRAFGIVDELTKEVLLTETIGFDAILKEDDTH